MNANTQPYVVDISPAERRRTASLVKVRQMKDKGGMGVVAVTGIPPLTKIGTYPGQRYTGAEYGKRREAGLTDGKFAVDFWKPDARGVPRTGYVIDPGNAHGTLLPRFAAAVAPLVNEPGEGGAPNAVWVWNLPKNTLELWSLRAIGAGQEVTLCYGNGGGYVRDYGTSCASRPGEVEPELHVITRPGTRPVPYSSLGNAGVRNATLALRA